MFSEILNLQLNDLIQWHDKDRVTRIIWISQDRFSIGIFSINDSKAFPELISYEILEHAFTSDNAHLLEDDPYNFLRVLPDKDIDPLWLERRDNAYESIRDIVENEVSLIKLFSARERGILSKEVHEKHNTTERMFYLRIRRYFARGMVRNALLPDYRNSGGKGKEKQVKAETQKLGKPSRLEKALGERLGITLTVQDKEKLARGYKQFYGTNKLPTLKQAWIKTLNLYFNKGFELSGTDLIPILPEWDQLPTIGQFEYWGKKLNPKINIRKSRIGKRRYELEERAILGNSNTRLPGPGWVFQIDATIADIYLVSKRNPRQIIGRPVLYIVKDVFSRYIVGFAVTLDGPSWLGAMTALETVTANKVELCASYGIQIQPHEWRNHHLPQTIIADRGELISSKAEGMVKGLGIRVVNLPAWRADWKGIVEQHFNLINDMTIKWQPGAIYSREGRGSPDYRLDAKHTLHDFRRIIIQSILYFNNGTKLTEYNRDEFMLQDQISLYPYALWDWGIQNRSGFLRTEKQNNVRANLLEPLDATVYRNGIYCDKLWYSSDDKFFTDKFSVLGDKSEKIKVIKDPRLTDYIYHYPVQEAEPIVCHLRDSDRSYAGSDWYEMQDEFDRVKQQDQIEQTNVMRAEARYQAEMDNFTSSVPKPDVSGMSKTERISNIKVNRKEERELEHKEQGWRLGVQHQPISQSFPSEDDEDISVPYPSPHKHLIEKLENNDE